MQLSLREPVVLHGLIAVRAFHRLIVENDRACELECRERQTGRLAKLQQIDRPA